MCRRRRCYEAEVVIPLAAKVEYHPVGVPRESDGGGVSGEGDGIEIRFAGRRYQLMDDPEGEGQGGLLALDVDDGSVVRLRHEGGV